MGNGRERDLMVAKLMPPSISNFYGGARSETSNDRAI